MENKSLEEKLEALLKLQKIDSELDQIVKVRGDLPEEVRDLEDELIGYTSRLEKYKTAIDELKAEIDNRKIISKNADKLIEKYKEQQMKVRNNREFGAITKEIELQELEIKISEKKIAEFQASIDEKKKNIDQIKTILDSRKTDLESKKEELDVLIKESEQEEKNLLKKRGQAENDIEERLKIAYNKIRKNAKNGLAVVSVKRGACGGCFNTVPPQRQADIASKKKIIVCEYCGRILADVDIVIVSEEEEAAPKRRTARTPSNRTAAQKGKK